jgi:hypothetical protein
MTITPLPHWLYFSQSPFALSLPPWRVFSPTWPPFSTHVLWRFAAILRRAMLPNCHASNPVLPAVDVLSELHITKTLIIVEYFILTNMRIPLNIANSSSKRLRVSSLMAPSGAPEICSKRAYN